MENQEDIDNYESDDLDDTIFELREQVEDLKLGFKLLMALNLILVISIIISFYLNLRFKI